MGKVQRTNKAVENHEDSNCCYHTQAKETGAVLPPLQEELVTCRRAASRSGVWKGHNPGWVGRGKGYLDLSLLLSFCPPAGTSHWLDPTCDSKKALERQPEEDRPNRKENDSGSWDSG